jgi:hypothetical protein
MANGVEILSAGKAMRENRVIMRASPVGKFEIGGKFYAARVFKADFFNRHKQG